MPRTPERPHSPGAAARQRDVHVGFAPCPPTSSASRHQGQDNGNAAGVATPSATHLTQSSSLRHVGFAEAVTTEKAQAVSQPATSATSATSANVHGETPLVVVSPSTERPREASEVDHPVALDTNVPLVYVSDEHADTHAISPAHSPTQTPGADASRAHGEQEGHSPYLHHAPGSDSNMQYFSHGPNLDNERIPASALRSPPKVRAYTHNLRQQPARTFTQQLKPYHGRLNGDKWLKVMVRPFILFSYPAVLWSSAVYACSIGWLIVISETMAIIYRDPTIYNFTALQTGLVYISPFVGGVLGTGVAGKISDIIVRAMSRRNGGLYEPEFRLVMAIPIMITTCVGLMGFGWSAEAKDHWIVPTLFFGILSFGCSLGSTTAITFCVDSYRQYAGEALVTLNFSKNVLHGLVFSLFVSHWMVDDGPKTVYIWLGIIQLIVQLTTIPLFIYGKRARMWTVRKNLMEKF